ncbi:MAG: hypothetical protein CFH22_00946 [Alphaproteobacteria bacterium MarineAlpha5_Bin12]|nr:MAG: hypothetical protein CFH22_00946 [Alphaproteobacteria bacterium MarineAlpha5_Bin12]|tara:strand:+ start:372 stop:683 length:312 start_codon:yes stop_codon:yes gene_type:complete
MTTKLKRIKQDKKNLPWIEKVYKFYVILAYRRWRKFNPLKPSLLLECYFYLLVARIILHIIMTRISILKTFELMIQRQNIMPLIFLVTLITYIMTIIKFNAGV